VAGSQRQQRAARQIEPLERRGWRVDKAVSAQDLPPQLGLPPGLDGVPLRRQRRHLPEEMERRRGDGVHVLIEPDLQQQKQLALPEAASPLVW
jgi:hypothetical protein